MLPRSKVRAPIGDMLEVVMFLIVQHIANNNDGKVFGIEVGFRDDGQDDLANQTRVTVSFWWHGDARHAVKHSVSGALFCRSVA
jgi:hypothetical protein